MQYETWWVVTLLLAVTWFWPRLGDRGFCAIENFCVALSQRKTLAVWLAFLIPVGLRLAFLPLVHYPYPAVHDEFSYLVQADIFAHGHLAMPSHPMSKYFETFYVNFHPTYSSMYPPAQASILALGVILGHPWVGVLLSSGAMFAALLWMLQGWFPPHWALLGTILAILRLDVFSYWINSYWGGAIAACAGALVMGALPRIRRYSRARDAFILGLGVCILANSRPLEGLIFSLAIGGVLVAWLVRQKSSGNSTSVRTVILPISLCLLANVLFTLYYDWRVTGSALTFPHEIYYRKYMSVPPFLWQKIMPPLVYANEEFRNFYSGWVRAQYNGTLSDALRVERDKAYDFWKFFFGVALSIPFVTLPWMIKDRKTRLFLSLFIVSAAGLLSVTWFLPHYAAPVFAVIVGLQVQAIRHMRRWKFRGRDIGVGWTRVVLLLTLCMIPACSVESVANPRSKICLNWFYNWDRAEVVQRLEALPGEHLVLVRYGLFHNVHEEWVYNAADIDHSKIVWARMVDGMDVSPLLSYYAGRRFWVVEIGGDHADLHPLRDSDLAPAPANRQ